MAKKAKASVATGSKIYRGNLPESGHEYNLSPRILMERTTHNSRIIKATATVVYGALTDPKAMEIWQVPGEMVGKVHSFDLREGGGYEMSLFYPDTEKKMTGKTSKKEDRFSARFIELNPPEKIVEAIKFDSEDAGFSEEMMMEITLQPADEGTKVTFLFKNLPEKINPKDNEAGTISSLEKLAKYVE